MGAIGLAKNKLVKCFGWTLLLLVVLEFGLAAVGFGDPILYTLGGKHQYRITPNQKKHMVGPLVQINSLGMRGPEPDKAREDIVFFGDSITYGGNGLQDTSTFVSLIDQRLATAGYEALNAGVNGYGPENIMELFLFHKQNMALDRIVLVVPSIDLTRGYQTTGFFDMVDERNLFLTRSHFFLRVITWEVSSLLYGKVFSSYNRMTDEERTARLVATLGSNIQSYQTIVGHTDQVIVFYVPSRSENSGASPHNKYRSQVLEALSAHNPDAEIVDLSGSLAEHGAAIYRDEWHFNAAGHEVLANLMFPLISQELLKPMP